MTNVTELLSLAQPYESEASEPAVRMSHLSGGGQKIPWRRRRSECLESGLRARERWSDEQRISYAGGLHMSHRRRICVPLKNILTINIVMIATEQLCANSSERVSGKRLKQKK